MHASIILYQFQFLMKSCIISLVVNNVSVIEMRCDKVFIYGEQCRSWLNSADLGRMLRSLLRSPIVSLTLFDNF